MKLIQWEPLSEIDRFFEDLPAVSFPRLSWDIAVDLFEEKGNMVAKLSVPGIDPDKIEVSVENNILRISGTREEEREEKSKHYYSKEIRRGAFERSVRLPKAVDNTKVNAEYKSGTLEITMPIVVNEKGSTVQIKVIK